MRPVVLHIPAKSFGERAKKHHTDGMTEGQTDMGQFIGPTSKVSGSKRVRFPLTVTWYYATIYIEFSIATTTIVWFTYGLGVIGASLVGTRIDSTIYCRYTIRTCLTYI